MLREDIRVLDCEFPMRDIGVVRYIMEAWLIPRRH